MDGFFKLFLYWLKKALQSIEPGNGKRIKFQFSYFGKTEKTKKNCIIIIVSLTQKLKIIITLQVSYLFFTQLRFQTRYFVFR